ncbi:MAG: RnfABCDGE type electron transport complex subunit D [Dehalococcoidales bacterium]|nr:MAG: RnfABCDGE type electron transport complex subunit D [Dehalococcoidales bacterium]
MTSVKELLVSPGPHLWRETSINRIMYIVILTLLLPAGAAVYYFGARAIFLILGCVLAAVATEYGVKKLRKRPFRMDGSAIITGLLLALILPSSLPVWMAVVGSVFAIAIVKEAFGGLGHNIFNPALGARAFLAVCFPVEMTTWILPTGFSPDAVTTATPLSERFVWEGSKSSLYGDMLVGNTAGSLGETSALLIIIGGIILIMLKLIDWRIPLTYIGTVALFTLILGEDVLYYLLSGGLMLGAFFMATDYTTSPLTRRGKVVFGIGAGIITTIIRIYGGMSEGVCFSILFMNAATPLIDRYLKTKPYGLVKKAKSEA